MATALGTKHPVLPVQTHDERSLLIQLIQDLHGHHTPLTEITPSQAVWKQLTKEFNSRVSAQTPTQQLSYKMPIFLERHFNILREAGVRRQELRRIRPHLSESTVRLRESTTTAQSGLGNSAPRRGLSLLHWSLSEALKWLTMTTETPEVPHVPEGRPQAEARGAQTAITDFGKLHLFCSVVYPTLADPHLFEHSYR